MCKSDWLEAGYSEEDLEPKISEPKKKPAKKAKKD